MQVRLGICIKDSEYAERICRYLGQAGKDRLEVRVSDPSAWPEADVWLTEDPNLQPITRTILMMTEEEAGTWKGERIDPYLPGSRLYRQCMRAIRQLEERRTFPPSVSGQQYVQEAVPETEPVIWNNPAEKHSTVLSVYSPVGGIGKSTLAVAVADALAQLYPQAKVLYLNLEGASAWKVVFRGGSLYNLSDLIYGMLLDDLSPESWKELLQETAVRQSNGVFFIAPCNDFDDLDVLEESEIEQLLSSLGQWFDYIVCDLNNLMHRVTRQVLLSSHRRFFITGNTPEAMARWLEMIGGLKRQMLYELLFESNARVLRILYPGEKEKKVDRTLDLPYEKDLWQEKDGLRGIRRDTEWYQKILYLTKEAMGLAG